ncbi:MAG: type II toxin-antitoxin system Phd/YefM family antitoxin [Actinobacteria bacterium]|nr:type II toxin-antitoxin system Phd/YefM family antitoxin [Actinomycetota bacterium]
MMTERTISATEARVHFGELMDSVVHNLDIVYVQRAGVPQVVVVPLEVWKKHQKKDDPWTAAARRMEAHWEYMKEARKAGRIKDVGPSTEEIIRAMREEPYE